MSFKFSGGSALSITIFFVVMKLANIQPIAGLNWLWVLSPLWISLVMAIAWFIVGAVLTAILGAIGAAGSATYAHTRTTRPVAYRGGYVGLPNNEKAFSYNYGAGRRS